MSSHKMKLFVAAIVGLFIICGVATAGHSAGIDCKHAQAQFDKTLCSDPRLVDQDQAMNTAYDAIKKKLSVDAQDDFRLGQKTWLRKQCNVEQLKAEKVSQKVCGNDAGCVAAPYDSQNDCIWGEYNNRIQSLEEGLKNSKENFLIVDNTLSGVFPPLEEDDDSEGNAGVKISYPQIYVPYSEGIKKWNAAQRKVPHNDKGDDDCQRNLSYTIGLTTSNFVSFEFSEDWYCKGMNHPNDNADTQNISLPSGNLLQANDIFDKSTHWEEALSKMVSEGLKPNIGFQCPGPKCESSPENLKNLVTNPLNWQINPGGLTIVINNYTITDYADSPGGVDLSWEQLKLYLRKDFLAALPR